MKFAFRSVISILDWKLTDVVWGFTVFIKPNFSDIFSTFDDDSVIGFFFSSPFFFLWFEKGQSFEAGWIQKKKKKELGLKPLRLKIVRNHYSRRKIDSHESIRFPSFFDETLNKLFNGAALILHVWWLFNICSGVSLCLKFTAKLWWKLFLKI